MDQSPLFGTGAGSFKYGYSEVVADVQGWPGLVSDDPHQQFLHICAEYGLVGLIIFLAALLAIAASGSTSSFHVGKIILMCFLLGSIANSFFNGHFSSFVEGRFAWIFLFALCSGTDDRFGEVLKQKLSVFRNLTEKIAR